jgi:hypothetical protein
MKLTLKTPFKGSRHYVQGGDLFNAVQANAEIATGARGAYISSLSFNRFAYHLCDLIVDDHANQLFHNAMGTGEFTLPDGTKRSFHLIEGRNAPRERVPYDEDGYMEPAVFTEQAATLLVPIAITSIEAVIALTKVLNYRLSIPKAGKWVFGKITLKEALQPIESSLSITRAKSVPGRFSVNDITIDDRHIGVIQFIVGAP